MAWRLRQKLRRAPPGVDLVAEKLEEFEQKMRAAHDAPLEDKRRNELLWPTHKVHYQRNRYIYDMHYNEKRISKKLLDYLVKEKVCDGKLICMWRKNGYERLCSMQAITRSNTNFRTVSVCRTPLRHRTSQITPNVMTGCVSCASGDKGPIWWDDPVPDTVKRRIAAIDPGKLCLVDIDQASADVGAAVDESDQVVSERARKLRKTAPSSDISKRANVAVVGDVGSEEDGIISERARKLRGIVRKERQGDAGDIVAVETGSGEDAVIAERARKLREGTRQENAGHAEKAESDNSGDDVVIMERARLLRESTAQGSRQ